jgi:hypothetical protein
MKPATFLRWTFVLSAAFFTVLMAFHVTQEVVFRDFPILRPLLQTHHPIIAAFLITAGSTVIATAIVFMFGATRGDFRLAVFGFAFSGPSGALTLWCAVFLAIIVALSVLTRIS